MKRTRVVGLKATEIMECGLEDLFWCGIHTPTTFCAQLRLAAQLRGELLFQKVISKLIFNLPPAYKLISVSIHENTHDTNSQIAS